MGKNKSGRSKSVASGSSAHGCDRDNKSSKSATSVGENSQKMQLDHQEADDQHHAESVGNLDDSPDDPQLKFKPKGRKRARDTDAGPECGDTKRQNIEELQEDDADVNEVSAEAGKGRAQNEEILDCSLSEGCSDQGDKTSPRMQKKSESRTTSRTIKSRVFEDEAKQNAVLVMSHPETIVLKGKAFLGCLSGSVEIFGFTMTPSSKTYPVYSSDTNSLITVNTKGSADPDGTVLREFLSESSSGSLLSDVEKAMSSVDNPTVLLIQRLQNKTMNLLSNLHPYQSLFSGNKCKTGRVDHEEVCADCIVLKPQGLGLYRCDDRLNSLRFGKDFSSIVDWLSKELSKGRSPVIAVCGGKDVGKSTTTRYLINKTIELNSSVAYMECDLGQTEFTPPSCVSLNVVTSPVLGPPFSHQRESVCSCCVGALSPQNDPKYYMRCIAHLHQHYLSLEKKHPLIINTMGWIQGIGLGFLADTLKMVRPDLVIQMESHNRFKNMEMVTTDFIQSKSGWMSSDSYSYVENFNPKSHSLMTVKSCLTQDMENSVFRRRYRPSDHRNLSLLMHLNQSIIHEKSIMDFNNVTPFEVPWGDVAVHVAHSAVLNSQVMYALNASVVVLCSVAQDALIESDVKGYPKFIKGSPIFENIGFGIVRGINEKTKVFYIVTSVPAAKCALVNCLVRSAVELPSQLSMGQKSSSAIPYIGYPKDVIGSSSVGPRRHVLKKPRRSGPSPGPSPAKQSREGIPKDAT